MAGSLNDPSTRNPVVVRSGGCPTRARNSGSLAAHGRSPRSAKITAPDLRSRSASAGPSSTATSLAIPSIGNTMRRAHRSAGTLSPPGST
jgi:hypothetical protein